MKPQPDEKDQALIQWFSSLEGNYQYRCYLAFNKFMVFLREKHGWKEVSGDTILSKHIENR
ncbi:MAG TPA: hypothetical protein VJ574_08280, partial [Candidatus Bathyarchaeia archaeon]|nr:hypothetical protein [Candidatus Bathyarchaeia archaeon]